MRTHIRIHYTVHTMKHWYWDSQSMHKYVYTYTCNNNNKHIHIHIHTHMHIYTYIHVRTRIHIHMYTHTHTQCTHERTQSTSKTTAWQRLRWKPNLTPRSTALLPIRWNPEGDTLGGQQPNCPSRGTTDKRRTTTINSSSSHHHDSAPSRPHPLIYTGAEPIHPVHGPPKLRAWPWPPETKRGILAGFYLLVPRFFADPPTHSATIWWGLPRTGLSVQRVWQKNLASAGGFWLGHAPILLFTYYLSCGAHVTIPPVTEVPARVIDV